METVPTGRRPNAAANEAEPGHNELISSGAGSGSAPTAANAGFTL